MRQTVIKIGMAISKSDSVGGAEATEDERWSKGEGDFCAKSVKRDWWERNRWIYLREGIGVRGIDGADIDGKLGLLIAGSRTLCSIRNGGIAVIRLVYWKFETREFWLPKNTPNSSKSEDLKRYTETGSFKMIPVDH